MSSTLFFRRTPPDRKLCSFGQPIKGVLARRFYGHDGSLGGDLRTIDSRDVAFFEGVAAACADEKDRKALQLIVDALEEDGMIDMWFEV